MNDYLKQIITDDGGFDVDHTKPLIRVCAYKSTGKWYSTKWSNLKAEHIAIVNTDKSFEIEFMIINNAEQVSDYSPLAFGFKNWNDYFYVVECFNVTGFMKRLLGNQQKGY